MNYIKITALFFLLILLNSCKSDFEVNAEWKEIPVVYGLLNSGDTVQYIRVMKAYLNNNTDALEIAKIPDSLYFDSLEVSLLNLSNGKRVVFIPDYSIVKDTGIFQSAYNRIYRTPIGDGSLNQDNRYRLEITNIYSGKKTVSETEMVHFPTPQYPNQNTPTLDFRPNNFNVPFDWKSGKNARVYDADFRLYFEEMNAIDTNQRVSRYVDMSAQRNITTNALGGSENMGFDINGKDFLGLVASYIKADASVIRRARTLEIRYYGGSDDLYTYMSVNKPSIGIVQKKPEFTNIEGGYGLFSSRHTYKILPINLSDSTRFYLHAYPATANLNFINPY